MSTELQQLILAAALAAHGIGHILFLVPAWTRFTFQQPVARPSESWLLTPALGLAPSRAICGLLAFVALVGFAVAGAGLVFDQAWVVPVTVVSSVVSAGLVAGFWNGLSSSRIPALAFDVVIVVAALAAWPSAAAWGS
jgi:hypothetical protein